MNLPSKSRDVIRFNDNSPRTILRLSIRQFAQKDIGAITPSGGFHSELQNRHLGGANISKPQMSISDSEQIVNNN